MLKRINIKSVLSITLMALAALLNSACDDSDEDGGSEVVLNSFGPSGVHHGETIRFIGQNLDKVTAIVLKPNVEIPSSSFASRSATLIELVVPQEAEAGKVILKTPSGDIESKTILNLEVPVVVTSITEEAKPGTNITITGEKLNWIETVTFSQDVLVEKESFVSQSGSELVVTVPMEAQTGFITFTSGGTEPLVFDSEEELIVTLPTVSGLNPASVKHTDNLTVSGTDLDLVTEIKFTGADPVFKEDFVSQSENEIVVAVPATTTSGKLILSVASGVTIETSAISIILPNVTEFSPSNTANHTPGTLLSLIGTDLDLVEKIKFPGVDEPVTDFVKTATKIDVTIPDGAEGGTMVLTTIHGFTVPVAVPFGNQLTLATVIYDDAIHTPLGPGGGWGGVVTDAASTENPRLGSKSIKITFAGSWGGGGQFGNWSTGQTFSTAGATYFALSVFGGAGTEGKKINVNVSGVQAVVTIKENEWQDIQIPLSSVGSPAGIAEIWFQDQGFSGVVFIDHIGLK
jgi:hypothetical protein